MTMAQAAVERAQPPRLALSRDVTVWAACALVVTIALQFTLVVHRSINWDEFWFYSQVEDLARGRLAWPLQTLHTRVFAWILDVPGTNVDRIVAARIVMFGCELATSAIIASLAARFTDRKTGLLCALCYVSTGFVFQHGYEFRTDPITTMLLMCALWLVLTVRIGWMTAVLIGLIVATAGMFTIKIVLYAPVFAGVIWLQWCSDDRSHSYLLKIGAAGAAAILAFALLYYLHSRGIAMHDNTRARSILGDAGSTMFSTLLNYWGFALNELLLSPIQSILILATPLILWRSDRPLDEKLCLTGFWLPITTLLFYHNTAPYYYAFMLAPVMVASSVAIAATAARFGGAVLVAFLIFGMLLIWAGEPPSQIGKQRTLLRAAETMFPTPVAYFDFCAMLGNFPKANIFMTPWGISIYKAGGAPSVRETLARQTVPLIVVDDPMYMRALKTNAAVPEFLPDDLAAMRGGYIHFWGPYWLAGRDIPAGSRPLVFDFLVPGPYTVRGGPATIDGVRHQSGDVVDLQRGRHVIADHPGAVQLVWGNRIVKPALPAPAEPYFTEF